jgi:hypothetical protein
LVSQLKSFLELSDCVDLGLVVETENTCLESVDFDHVIFLQVGWLHGDFTVVEQPLDLSVLELVLVEIVELISDSC